MTSVNPIPSGCTASEAVSEGMYEYGKYLAKSKPPHEVDGLKSVIRRILYAQHIDSKEVLLGVPLLGRIMDLHFHSDAPIWDALARVSRHCAVNDVLLHCDGNVGEYTNPIPGAPRYPKFTKEPFTQDLYFNGVHPLTLPMVESENFCENEPEYLIPIIPAAFLFPDTTIGYSFKTTLVPLAVTELCELTKRFLDSRKGCLKVSDEFYKKNARYFIPEFPTSCLLRNYEELLKAYKDGDFEHRIVIDGTMDILPNSLILKTAAFDHKFHDIKSKFFETIKTKGSWLNDIYVDHQDNAGAEKNISAEFIINIKRGANPFNYLDSYKLLSKFTHIINPIRNYVGQKGIIHRRTPAELFEIWYLEKSKSVAGGIKHRQAECIRELLALHAKCVACDHSNEIAQIIKSHNRKAQIIPILIEKYELTPYQASVVYNSPIHSFSEETKMEMQSKIEDQRKKAQSLTADITRIPELMYLDTCQFQKKYGKSYRRTKLPNFIGYLHIPKFSGIIQFTSIDEALELLDIYSNVSGKIHFYSFNNFDRLLMLGNKIKHVDGCIPKQVVGSTIIEIPNRTCYTLCISDGTASYVKGIHIGDDDKSQMQRFIVTSEFIGINQDGTLEQLNINDMTMRKKIGRKGTKTSLIGVIPSTCVDCIVFHMNDVEPDVVRWDRIIFGKSTRMTNVPMGNMKILDIVPFSEGSRIISLDSACASSGLEYLHISNLTKLVGKNLSSSISLGRKISRHKTLRRLALI